ncbi:MAG: aldo/keto reductase [Deltaproteobacteria bacterium]|nr:aldo/keto reductase [Deltaproteobacteria bacterium]
MTSGKAGIDGSQDYATRHDTCSFNHLGKTGLRVSAVGFGCYRVDRTVDAHYQALSKALSKGVNLIDTSTNYADGGSELLVGAVIRDLAGAGGISRDSVVVVSKAGYLQGKNYDLSQERKSRGKPFPDVVSVMPNLEHCIHPEFLEDQLTRSLERLDLQTLDVFLLHNPEYFLTRAMEAGESLLDARNEYYRRIELAFNHLESEVERGRIQYYGISSNTFPHSGDHPECTCLETVWNIAQTLGEDNHFQVVEMPLNLLEPNAVLGRNQPNGQSVLEFARDKQLGVLINRPLNAIVDHKLLRLADVEPTVSAGEVVVNARIRDLIASEDLLKQELFPNLNLKSSLQKQLEDAVSVGYNLKRHWKQYGSYLRWLDVQTQFLIPKVQGVVQFLAQQDLSDEMIRRVEAHVRSVQESFFAVTSVYQAEASKQAGFAKKWVAAADRDWGSPKTLSQMAIRAIRSTPGITTVLVGMRQDSYVEDALEECRRPVDQESDRAGSWRKLTETIPDFWR